MAATITTQNTLNVQMLDDDGAVASLLKLDYPRNVDSLSSDTVIAAFSELLPSSDESATDLQRYPIFCSPSGKPYKKIGKIEVVEVVTTKNSLKTA